MKKKNFYFLIFFSFFLLLILSKINLKILDQSNLVKFNNYNFQGIECFNNEIFLLSNFDHKIYKLTEDLKLIDFLDTSIAYKNTYLVHFTSFFIKKKNLSLVNSYERKNGVMIIVNINNITHDQKFLKNLNYELKFLNTKNNHIEFDEKNNLIFFDKSRDNLGNSKLEIYKDKIDNKKKLCTLKHNITIQNLYSDGKNNLLILSNLIFYRFGLVYNYNIEQICNKKKINFSNANSIDLIFNPSYELQALTFCRGKKIYLFTNKKNSYLHVSS